MAGFVVRRILVAVPVLLLVTLLSFTLLELAPGDAARAVAGEAATPEQVEQIRAELGLDRPLALQYLSFVGDALRLDLGRSAQDSRPVTEILAEAFPVTASLTLVGLALAVLLAVPAGAVAALWRGRLPDRLVTAAAALFLAVPPFVVALLLVVTLAIRQPLLPAVGYVDFTESPADWLAHLVLPGTALALYAGAELVRQVRGGLVDALERDFIRTSRAKGLRERLVVGKHAARAAAAPAVTVFGLQVGRILGGAVLIEFVFALPGFGSLAVNAVTTQDVPLIQGVVLVAALCLVAVNLSVDLVCGVLNPRLRT